MINLLIEVEVGRHDDGTCGSSRSCGVVGSVRRVGFHASPQTYGSKSLPDSRLRDWRLATRARQQWGELARSAAWWRGGSSVW